MATARVLRLVNTQAVRLPKEFRFKSKQVAIFRRGDEIIRREKGEGLACIRDLGESFPSIFDRKVGQIPHHSGAGGCDAFR